MDSLVIILQVMYNVDIKYDLHKKNSVHKWVKVFATMNNSCCVNLELNC